MAGLSGTGRLADDLYLMAHHEVSGRPHLQARAIGLGLAGALLAELMLTDMIRIAAGAVVTAGHPTTDDQLGRDVLHQMASEHQERPVRDWLAFLARTAARDVALRLARSGYLSQASTRRPWRGERWVPVDSDCAFAPVTRVKTALDPSRSATAAGVALAGLAAGCGLGSRLSLYLPPGAYRHLDAAVHQLDPGLREVIAQTQAAVDSALLAHRV